LEMARRELPKITTLGKTMEPVTVETLRSSGTIKTITDRLGVLAKR
jgi:RNase P/RNase MRP subunit POP5